MIIPAELARVNLDDALEFQHPDFIAEEKFDGVRAVVHVEEQVRVTGRRIGADGQVLPLRLHHPLPAFHAMLLGCVLDSELMADGTFHVFDLLRHHGQDTRPLPLRERKARLASLSDYMPAAVRLVASYACPAAIPSFREGIVIKDLRSRYGHGWWKAKRIETHDVRLLRVGDNGVAETEGRGKVQGVPPGIQAGDMIEVRAFALFASGKLRNGRFMRVRADK